MTLNAGGREMNSEGEPVVVNYSALPETINRRDQKPFHFDRAYPNSSLPTFSRNRAESVT
jgi:hypothetical protein